MQNDKKVFDPINNMNRVPKEYMIVGSDTESALEIFFDLKAALDSNHSYLTIFPKNGGKRLFELKNVEVTDRYIGNEWASGGYLPDGFKWTTVF